MLMGGANEVGLMLGWLGWVWCRGGANVFGEVGCRCGVMEEPMYLWRQAVGVVSGRSQCIWGGRV